MPRIGQNPAKWLNNVYRPKVITLCTAVHIPTLSGYWEHAVDVLDRSLTSMVITAGENTELMVLDNNSCPEVCDYLRKKKEEGLITYLLLSRHNLGKVGAWNILFLGAPGEFIAYADSDVLFFDGWLRESLKIFEAFPKAGMVTAQPIAGYDQTLSWTAESAESDPTVATKTGILIPGQFLNAHLAGIQANEEELHRRQKDRKDLLLIRGAVSAYGTASHFQFLTKKSVVGRFFPAKASLPLGGDNQFEIDMKEFGYWRLSTTDYLVHHMGNRLPDLTKEVPWLRFDTKHQSSPGPIRNHNAPIKSPKVRKVLKSINAWTYRCLYG